MSLQAQQNFLARLYTDTDLRRAFLSEPQSVGAANDLNEFEIAELAAVLPEELNFFAESLFWKRLRETEKFLPLTKNVLGADFEKLFREFSQNFNPQAIKKHLEDAIEFCRFLQEKDGSNQAKDAAKFEMAGLTFNSNAKNFMFAKFDFDMREVLENFPLKKQLAEINFRKRKTFAIWLRIGKIKKHFIW